LRLNIEFRLQVIKKLLRSEFIRNVSTLMSGTAIAQAIPVLISPILSRLYTPDDFGVLALYMSITVVIGVIATGRYELAIMLPNKQKSAFNILVLCILLSLITALLTFILLLLFIDPIVVFFEEPKVKDWIYFIPIIVFFTGVYQAFNYWSTRHKTYKRNAFSRISQSTMTAGSQLGYGFIKSGAGGLILGYIIGIITAALVLGWKIIKNIPQLTDELSIKEIKENARKYRNFIRINSPHAFIDSLQDNGIIYLIMYFFSKQILGSYSFAYRILKAPVGLVGNAIYQVSYQKATEAFNAGQNLQPMVKRILINLFIIGFPVFTILFIYTPEFFSFIFGAKWREAGEFAQILIPWIFLNFLANPVSFIAIVVNKQKEAMYFTIANIIVKVLSIVIGGIYGNYFLSFIILSILGSLLMIFALFWYYKIADTNSNNNY